MITPKKHAARRSINMRLCLFITHLALVFSHDYSSTTRARRIALMWSCFSLMHTILFCRETSCFLTPLYVIVWFPWRMISLTRPTSPPSRRTLIPWWWTGELVRMSFTIPFVSVPDRWSFFKTMYTCDPGCICSRLVPSICLSSLFSRHLRSFYRL